MNYTSTRDGSVRVGSARAIVQGISHEGGLFVPQNIAKISLDQIMEMRVLSYPERAARVLKSWLDGFDEKEILAMCCAAYARFDCPEVAPVRAISDSANVLELFHGPTLAFKDVALQLLPRLMTAAARKTGETREIRILVATSGDTGKAALEGFADVPGVSIAVFYPQGGVSEAQRLQMVTQTGKNVRVFAVRGNFDDAQTGVKRIFTDPAYAQALDVQGVVLSSANSINLGRLVPQIVYYFSAYADLLAQNRIRLGDPVNIVVPTGNFGNILAAYYAGQMGLPVGRLICASNSNNVLSDFIRTGVYDRNRPFYLTTSPSMDILISSNLERLLFELAEHDDDAVRGWMAQLANEGRYALTGAPLERLQTMMYGGWADEQAVAGRIRTTFERYGYLCDPHTAVALEVYDQYVRETCDGRPAVVASTASPYKFGRAVLDALKGEHGAQMDDFGCCNAVAAISGQRVPEAISTLKSRPVLHTAVCDPNDMPQALERAFAQRN